MVMMMAMVMVMKNRLLLVSLLDSLSVVTDFRWFHGW